MIWKSKRLCVCVCVYIFSFMKKKKGLAEVCFWMVGCFFFVYSRTNVDIKVHILRNEHMSPLSRGCYLTAPQGSTGKNKTRLFREVIATVIYTRQQSVGVKNREGVCVCVYSYHGGRGGCLKLVLFMIFGSSGLKIPEVPVFLESLIIIRHHLTFGRDDA